MTMTSMELAQAACKPAQEKQAKHAEGLGGFRSTQVYWSLLFQFLLNLNYFVSVCHRGRFQGGGPEFFDNLPRCSNDCHCKNNDVCLFTNGSCPNGCALGWKGSVCNQIGETSK
jgi:hypothetical protein